MAKKATATKVTCVFAGIEFKVFIKVVYKGKESFCLLEADNLLSEPGNVVHQHHDGKESYCNQGYLCVGGDRV